MDKLLVRNRMSAKALIESQGENLDLVSNPKTGKLFFACRTIQGYVSPKVQESYDSLETSDLTVAECSKPGSNTWVWCLMMKGTNNVKKSFTL